MKDDKRKEALSHFYEVQGRKLERCHEPSATCTEPAIRAHSIPSRAVLSQLSDSNHVVMPQLTLGAKRTECAAFGKVGVNKATTFTGLCAAHDSATFQAIDLSAPDCNNDEHLFLMAYRAVLREYHAVLEAALRAQSHYQRQVELGLTAEDATSALGMLATGWIVNAIEFDEYKRLFDDAFLAKRWGDIEHRIIQMNGQAPVLAVSSLFSLDDIEADETPRVALTVFPHSTGTDAVFSSLLPDAEYIFRNLDPILRAGDHYQKYLLSKLVLQSCDNFVLSPRHFAQWSDGKQKKMLTYFTRTIRYNDESCDDPDLYLF